MVEHRDAVSHGKRFTLIVGHEHEGEAEALVQAAQLLLHVLAQLEIERAERLVEQQHLRPVDQRAGERHALPLAARQLRRTAIIHAFEPDEGQRLAGARLPLGARRPFDHQRIGDVGEDVHVREQRVILEDGVDVAPIGSEPLSGLAKDLDVAGGWLFETGDQTQTGRLARTGRSEHGEELALLDLQGDAVDGADGTEVPGDVLEQDGGGGCGQGGVIR